MATSRTTTATSTGRHTLVAAGAPHNAHGFQMPAAWGSTSGGGHAKCSCGEMSEDLASTNARKAWHRTHKAAQPAT